MLRKGVYILTLISIFSTHYAKGQNYDTTTHDDGNGWTFIQVRKDGKIYSEGKKHNGVEQGVWTIFWSTKYPETMTTYVDGKKDGLKMRIIEEGSLDYTEYYKNDLLDGPRRVFHIRGPMMEETYYAKGRKNGLYSKYYRSAVKQEDGAFLDNLRTGKTTWYSDDGKKYVEYEYKRGWMEGISTTYYKNGKTNETGNYSKDEKTGTWKEYYDTGIIKAEGNYEHNEKQGEWKQYDASGKRTKSIKYNKGEEVK